MTEPRPPQLAARPVDTNAAARRAARALDVFQRRVLKDGLPNHRRNKLTATHLVRELIKDLGHYADRAHLDFETILTEVAKTRSRAETDDEPAPERPFQVGSAVELVPDTARPAGPPRRGYVTAVEEPTDYGEAVYLVRFPGIPAGEFHLPATSLQPTAAFPAMKTQTGVVRSAAHAERELIRICARITGATRAGKAVELTDITDRALLAETLGHWTGTSGERVLFSIGNRVERAVAQLNPTDPARLSKADFPHDITNGVPAIGPEGPSQLRPGKPTSPSRRP